MSDKIGQKERELRAMRERNVEPKSKRKNGTPKGMVALREAADGANAGVAKPKPKPKADRERKTSKARAGANAKAARKPTVTNHRAGTISAEQPWVKEGISRRTWYRRQGAGK